MLLTERIAFTQREAFDRLRKMQPSDYNLAFIRTLIFMPIETMATLVSQQSIHLHDWRCSNIAFKDTEPLSVALIDWAHNVPYEGHPKR